MVRKTHWEQINATTMNTQIQRCKSLSRAFIDEPSNLQHLDSLQHSLQVLYPSSYSSGPSGGTMLRTLMFYAFFSGKIYYLAEAFAEELRHVKITVRAACIPNSNQIICIELPVWTGYQAVYISSLPLNGRDSTGEVYCRLEMQFCRLTEIMDKFDRVMMHFYQEDEKIEDAADRLGKLICVPLNVLKFALNAYLYVYSGQPDLREYAPPAKPLSKKPKIVRKFERQCESESLLPVTLVGFNFKKESKVAAHFQGYWTGEGRKTLALRWKESYSKGQQIEGFF